MPTEAVFVAERIGALLLLLALAMTVARALSGSLTVTAAAGLVTLVAAIVPVGRLPLVAYLFSAVGPLGSGSLVLLASAAAAALGPARQSGDRFGVPALAAVLLAIAVPFYVLALGFGPFDPYALGFSGPALPVALGALVVGGWWVRSVATVVWVGLGAALFLADAFASRNLVDYLIDPVAVLLATFVLAPTVRRFRQAAISRNAATTSS